MTLDRIYINSDNLITLDQVKKGSDLTPLNNGTAAYTIRQKSGNVLVASGNVPYVVSSVGQYQVVVLASVTALLKNRVHYFLEVNFTGSGFTGTFRKEVIGDYLVCNP